MNQTKLFLIAIMFIGTLLLGIGIYLALKPNQPIIVQTAPTNTPTISAATPQQISAKISKDITVPADVMWYDTGINVPNKAVVEIDYRSGQWTNEVGSNFVSGDGKYGYEERNKLIVPNSQLAALVAKVGNYKFHVGNSYNGKPGGGRLYLSINDIPKTYNDNKGELDVSVEVK